MRAGTFLRSEPMPEQRALKNVHDQRALAGTADARNTGQRAERNLHVDVPQIVLRRAHDFDPALVGRGPDAFLRDRDRKLARQIFRRERMRILQHFLERSRRHQFAATHARTGAEVHEVIRLAHRVLVMLDDEHGVPDVAQMPERREQAIVIALMQADARLVEDVKHANQARANLCREPDALRFAAAQRAALAIQGEIAEPDVLQEAQPRANFPHRLDANLLLKLGELEIREELIRLIHGKPADIHDGETGDHGPFRISCFAFRALLRCSQLATRNSQLGTALQRDRENLRLQPLAAARVAVLRVHERLEPVPRELAFALFIEPRHVRQHAFEGLAGFTHLARAPDVELDLLLARAVQQFLPELFRQILEGLFEADFVVRRYSAQQALVVNNHPLAAAPPRQDSAAVERPLGVRHHERLVEDHLLTQPMTDRTRTARRVEGKMFRCQRLEALARAGTVVAVRVQNLSPIRGRGGFGRLMQHEQTTIAPLQRRLNRVAETDANFVIDDQPIHNHVDAVLRLRIKLHAGVRS